jgi:hypothetical protein
MISNVKTHKPDHMEAEKITLSDRIVAAAISAFLMAIMAVGSPIALAFLTRGRGLKSLGVFGTLHIWGSVVVVVGFVAGFALGSERVIVLFAHLWGTERPERVGVTLSLWAALVGIVGISYWLFNRLHAL